MGKKRGVLKLWMAIILVFAGLVGVVGVTVLTLFLMGRFEDEVVKPLDMSFVQELDDGLGFYDESLSTNSVSYYKVASDFKLTISTTTEGVTEKKVTLALNNGVLSDGYITNGIIKVPQEVTLNRPFEVTLVKNPTDDWIVGGISTITATSQNVLLSKKTAQIAVDTPVKTLGLNVHGNNDGQAQEVIIGTNFTLDATFLPSNSANCFSNTAEKKRVFFSPSLDLTYDLATGVFTASENVGEVEVNAYAFANAYHQKIFMDNFNREFPNASLAQLNNSAITYLINNPSYCVSETIKINVVSVRVKSILFNNVNSISPSNPMNLTTDTYFRLTANSSVGNAKLGLEIKDTQNRDRNELFGNVGLKVAKGTSLKITGGRVMKVVKNGGEYIITQEDFNPSFDYAGASENTEYYILADNTPQEYINYGWTLSSASALEAQLSLNYFYKENGEWNAFFPFADEDVVGVRVNQKSNEEPPSWKDNDSIQMEITYNEKGEAIASHVTLSEYLNKLREDNIYTYVKYFLLVDGSFDGEITDSFSCLEYQSYRTDYLGKNLSIENITMPTEGYRLYEIDDELVLTAKRPFVSTDGNGKVYVVAGVIKTDADNKPEKDGNAYKLVNLSRAKQIVVNSTLSIANMKPTLSVDESITAIQENGADRYYIPAINVNESGETKNMLSLTLN